MVWLCNQSRGIFKFCQNTKDSECHTLGRLQGRKVFSSKSNGGEAFYLLTLVCLWETLVVLKSCHYQSYPATFTRTMCFFTTQLGLSSEKGHSHPANCSRTKGWRKPFPTPCYRVGLHNAELSEIQHNAQRFMRLPILHPVIWNMILALFRLKSVLIHYKSSQTLSNCSPIWLWIR